jgi:hypothetical protein
VRSKYINNKNQVEPVATNKEAGILSAGLKTREKECSAKTG